ncbi:MAG: site-specific integrase [Fimbriimonadaceae bacterium]|nr:site-specific integrase [Fimbriimonadaceae bacterium]
MPTVKHRIQNWQNQIAWSMDKYVLPEFGHRDIRELKRAEFQMFFNKISAELKASSVEKVKIVTSGVMRLAVADEVITVNPVTFVRIARKDPVEKTALTFQELHQLLDASGALIKPFVILAGCLGLRLGEAVGVTRGAISRSRVLSVRQQVQQLKGGCTISNKLKTDHSRREIPLPEPLYNALMSCGQVSDVWVCSDTLGGFVKPKNITRELKAACVTAGVPVVSPHELRHTFISLMDNEVEAPRTVVMALAGHVAQSTTDGYSHVKNEQKLRWVEKLWDQVSTACSPETWATRVEISGSN